MNQREKGPKDIEWTQADEKEKWPAPRTYEHLVICVR